MRKDGRKPDEMRPVLIERNYTKFAQGSVLIQVGDTRVICTASVDEGVPPHKEIPARVGYGRIFFTTRLYTKEGFQENPPVAR